MVSQFSPVSPNAQFNPKNKVTLEFGIILSLMLIVFQEIFWVIRFNTRFWTEDNPSFDLNRNFVFRINLSLKLKLLLLLWCAKRHMLSASRRQPRLLHVSAEDRRQTWSMDKS